MTGTQTPAGSEHPEALLASYVDGSASEGERGLAEDHLASCGRCREEVDLARAGRQALRALTELPAPGLAPQILARLPATVPSSSAEEAIAQGSVLSMPQASWEDRRRDERARRRVRWGAALAAAASVAALALFGTGVFSIGGGRHTAGAPAVTAPGQAAVGPAPSVLLGSTDYGPSSIAALAQRLAGGTKAQPSQREAPAPLVPSFQAPMGPVRTAPSPAAVANCLERGGGLEPGATPVYLEEATYQGTPAYIGGFLTAGGSPKLVVLAVTRDGCQPLYVIRQPA